MTNLSSKTDEVRTLLKRCKPNVIQAAVDYQTAPDQALVPIIVLGIIERYLEPEARPKLQDPNAENLALVADLGVDSLIIVEIVMAIEEVLSIKIPDDDLRNLRTVKDVKTYISQKVQEPVAVSA